MEITIERLNEFVNGQVTITVPANQQSKVGCGGIGKIQLRNGQVVINPAWYVTKPAGTSDTKFCAEYVDKDEIVFPADAFVGEIEDGGLKFFQEDSGTVTVLRPPNHPTLLDGRTLHAFAVREKTENNS